jgi:hypothetical protein
MRKKDFVSVVTACGLLSIVFAGPVVATNSNGICLPFDHKFKGELPTVVHAGLGLQCSVIAKAHVDPKGGCTSQICVSLHELNLLPEVGPPLEIEVVSECIDGGPDGDGIPTGYADGTGIPSGLPSIGSAAGPATPPFETSVCLGGAALGFFPFPTAPEGSAAGVLTAFPTKEGKIKINCDDGTAKTKGNYEYHCRRLVD